MNGKPAEAKPRQLPTHLVEALLGGKKELLTMSRQKKLSTAVDIMLNLNTLAYSDYKSRVSAELKISEEAFKTLQCALLVCLTSHVPG